MAATGKTPILLYGSTTATNVPVAGNLTNSSDGCEIAINVADKNLFFKDSTNAVNTVPIRQSSGSSDGWLSSANWTTFNSKQTAYTNLTTIGSLANATGWLYNNGSGTFSYSTPSASDVGAVPTTRTISTTSPLAGGGDLSANRTFSITQATTSTDGYLSSTDWNTFNNKVSSQWVTSGSDIYYNTGSVGVNCTPTTISNYRTLELRGATTGTGGIVRLSNSDNSQASWWYSYNTAAWFGNYTNIPLLMGVNNAETFRLDTSGNAKIANGNLVIGTSGKGIDFSATAGTGTSELLADYEEGTFTPVINGTTTAGTGTYTTQLGKYTKIGRVVTFDANIVLTNHTGTGNIRFAGLPYTSANDSIYSSVVVLPVNLALTAGNFAIGQVIFNSSQITLNQIPTGGGASSAIPMDTSFSIYISGSYTV